MLEYECGSIPVQLRFSYGCNFLEAEIDISTFMKFFGIFHEIKFSENSLCDFTKLHGTFSYISACLKLFFKNIFLILDSILCNILKQMQFQKMALTSISEHWNLSKIVPIITGYYLFPVYRFLLPASLETF